MDSDVAQHRLTPGNGRRPCLQHFTAFDIEFRHLFRRFSLGQYLLEDTRATKGDAVVRSPRTARGVIRVIRNRNDQTVRK
jgi:hypothetical protein